MAPPRIRTKLPEVRDQAYACVAGIAGEPAWPATAPTQAQLQAAADALALAITNVAALEAQIAVARQTQAEAKDAARDRVIRVDEVTDGLYGPTDPRKNNFGIPPRSAADATPPPVAQPIIQRVADGGAPGAIFVDWDSQDSVGAYQVEWFADSALTQKIGNATSTQSQFTITGLTIGSQYWIRVRGVRGTENGPWSDVATRVACV